MQDAGEEPQGNSSQGKRAKTSNDYSEMPSIALCLLNQHGRGKLTGSQVLYHCYQHFDGEHRRGEIDAFGFRAKNKEYYARTCASALIPGAIERASPDELSKCYVTVLNDKSEKALPVRFWFNLMKTIFKRASATNAWKNCSEKVFAFADPSVNNKAVCWDMLPEALPQIPLEKLEADDRWVLAEQLWLELLFPTFLTDLPHIGGETVPADVATLLVCSQGFQQAAGQSANPRPVASTNLLQCFALCCAPWQESPLSGEQMQLLQHVASPEEAPRHVKVVADIFDHTWQQALRKTMQYTIAEVRFQDDIEKVMSILRRVGQQAACPEESGEASELAALTEAWNLATSKDGWSVWCEKIRPRMVKVLRVTMVDSLQRCLNKSGIDFVSEVVRLSAWMEAHDSQAESQWGALHQKAQEKHLHATSNSRLAALVAAMEACSDGDAAALAVPEDPQVSNLIASCFACKGLRLAQENAPLLKKVLRLALACKPMANATAELVEQLSEMRPQVEDVSEDKENELVWAAVQVVKYGAPLLNSCGRHGAGDSSTLTQDQMHKYADLKRVQEQYTKAWTNVGHAQEPGLLHVWPDICEFVESLAQAQAKAAAEGAKQQEAKLKGKLDELQDMLAKRRWSQNLPAEPTWADVVREIEYTFWQKTIVGDASELADSKEAVSGKAGKGKKCANSGVMDQLEKLFADAQNLWTDHCKQYGEPKHLADAWKELSVASKVVNTEEYCVRQYVEKEDASRAKLARRQNQTAKFWDDIHPIIRAKVLEVTGM